MIAFLHGRICEKQPTRIVMDVGGVGYEVSVPLSSYDRLPPEGDVCRILIYDHVREDTHQLFGFVTPEERRLFVQLMDVSGIGPRLALSTLSGLSVRELKAAIRGGDIRRLSSISGIGKKTAERMVVELRDKIGGEDGSESGSASDLGIPPGDARARDAVLALGALGYKPVDAGRLVAEILRKAGAQELTVEEVVRKAISRP